MEHHALAILNESLLNFPVSQQTEASGRCRCDINKFLYHLIGESQKLGGTVLDQFWRELGACNPKLQENIEILREQGFVSANNTLEELFRGFNSTDIRFDSLLNMSNEYLSYFGVAIMNLGSPRPGSCSSSSDSEIVNAETEKLLEDVSEENIPVHQKREALKQLAFRRDGTSCPFVFGKSFTPSDPEGIPSILAYIIPNSLHGQSGTEKCITTLAGTAAAELVAQHLNSIQNVIVMSQDARITYDELRWGIEAVEDNGKIKYVYRRIPTVLDRAGPATIDLKDGDEIKFGQGPDGQQLNGPLPLFCNLHLAAARIMKMSGAADAVLKLKGKVDDEGTPGLFISSEKFCDMVTIKLLLSGRAIISIA